MHVTNTVWTWTMIPVREASMQWKMGSSLVTISFLVLVVSSSPCCYCLKEVTLVFLFYPLHILLYYSFFIKSLSNHLNLGVLFDFCWDLGLHRVIIFDLLITWMKMLLILSQFSYILWNNETIFGGERQGLKYRHSLLSNLYHIFHKRENAYRGYGRLN